MVHPGNGQIIERSNLASMVEPGMVLEMSINLRQKEEVQIGEEKCPRCGYINTNGTITSGWIE